MHYETPRVSAEPGSPRMLLYATVLVSLAALATSWAGYQATLWSGVQAQQANRAAALRTQSTQAATRAGQARAVDVGLFTTWLSAYSSRDTLLEHFLERRFRREFAVAFEAWMRDDPTRAGARLTPFEMPEYRIAGDSESRLLAAAADGAGGRSNAANQFGDAYVLTAVIFATTIFFGTAAQQARSRRPRLMLVTFATIGCVVGLFVTFTLPRGN
jgi:hypothetical protein